MMRFRKAPEPLAQPTVPADAAHEAFAAIEAERARLRAAIAEIDARCDYLETAPTRNHPFEEAGRAEMKARRRELAVVAAERGPLVAQLGAIEEQYSEAARAMVVEEFAGEAAELENSFREIGARLDAWMRAGAELFAKRQCDLKAAANLSERIRRAKNLYRIAPAEAPTVTNHPDSLAQLPSAAMSDLARMLERTLKDVARFRAPRPDPSVYKRTPYPVATTIEGVESPYAAYATYGHPGEVRR